MQRDELKNLFGSINKACEALGIGRKTYYNWPKVLTQAQEDRVRGAYTRIAEENDKYRVHSIGGKK